MFTCGVRLTVVLAAVLHFDGRQAEGLDHFVCALTPVRGAKRQNGEGQSQSGQGQGEQGAGATGHVLQHGHRGTMAGRGRGEEGVQVEPAREKDRERTQSVAAESQMEPRGSDRCFGVWRRGSEVILKAKELPSFKQGAKRKCDVTVETGG